MPAVASSASWWLRILGRAGQGRAAVLGRPLAVEWAWPTPVLALVLALVLQGLVTSVSDVKPLASVVTYTDETTGHELYQEVRRPADCSPAAPLLPIRRSDGVVAGRAGVGLADRRRSWWSSPAAHPEPGARCLVVQVVGRSFMPLAPEDTKIEGRKALAAPVMQYKGSK